MNTKPHVEVFQKIGDIECVVLLCHYGHRSLRETVNLRHLAKPDETDDSLRQKVNELVQEIKEKLVFLVQEAANVPGWDAGPLNIDGLSVPVRIIEKAWPAYMVQYRWNGDWCHLSDVSFFLLKDWISSENQLSDYGRRTCERVIRQDIQREENPPVVSLQAMRKYVSTLPTEECFQPWAGMYPYPPCPPFLPPLPWAPGLGYPGNYPPSTPASAQPPPTASRDVVS